MISSTSKKEEETNSKSSLKIQAILDQTKIETPNFQVYLTNYIDDIKVLDGKLMTYNFEAFYQMIKFILIYSNSNTINFCASLLCKNKIYSIIVFESTKKSPGIKLHIFIKSVQSTEKVIINFKEHILQKADCSCNYDDWDWCPHIILAFLLLFKREFGNLNNDEISKAKTRFSGSSKYRELNLENLSSFFKNEYQDIIIKKKSAFRLKILNCFENTKFAQFAVNKIFEKNLKNVQNEICSDIFAVLFDYLLKFDQNFSQFLNFKNSKINQNAPFKIGFSQTLICIDNINYIENIESNEIDQTKEIAENSNLIDLTKLNNKKTQNLKTKSQKSKAQFSKARNSKASKTSKIKKISTPKKKIRRIKKSEKIIKTNNKTNDNSKIKDDLIAQTNSEYLENLIKKENPNKLNEKYCKNEKIDKNEIKKLKTSPESNIKGIFSQISLKMIKKLSHSIQIYRENNLGSTEKIEKNEKDKNNTKKSRIRSRSSSKKSSKRSLSNSKKIKIEQNEKLNDVKKENKDVEIIDIEKIDNNNNSISVKNNKIEEKMPKIDIKTNEFGAKIEEIGSKINESDIKIDEIDTKIEENCKNLNQFDFFDDGNSFKEFDESIMFKSLVNEGEKNDFGFKTDCCGCSCHKAAIKHHIITKNLKCLICKNQHKGEHFIFRRVILEIFEKLNNNAKITSSNYFETMNLIDIFKMVSNFIFYYKNDIEQLNIFNKSIKKELSLKLTNIFKILFLSFNVNLNKYVDLYFLLQSWSKIIELPNVPEEGWFGPEIDNILAKKPPTKALESKKICIERIKRLITANRFSDGLVFSVAAKDYYYMAKCLSYLGRIDESIQCMDLNHLSHSDAKMFAQIFAKFDKHKAFDYFRSFLAKKKRIQNIKDLEWLVKNCPKDESSEKGLESIAREAINLTNLKLETYIEILIENKKINIAINILLNEFFREKRKFDDKKHLWVFQIVLENCPERINEFVDRKIAVMSYYYDLSIHITSLLKIMSDHGKFRECAKIGLRFTELFVDDFKKETMNETNLINSFIKLDNRTLISKLVDIIFQIKTENGKNNEDFVTINNFNTRLLNKIYEIKNIDIILEILQLISEKNKSKNFPNNLCVYFGKRIFALQFSFSRRDTLVRRILQWLLEIAFENEPYLDKISSPAIKEPLEASRIDQPEQVIDKAFSAFEVVHFCRENLQKYAGAYAQWPLLDVADFMRKNEVGDVKDILEVISEALKIGCKKTGEVVGKALEFYDLALKNKKQIATQIAKFVMIFEPNLKNYNRLASLYSEEGAEWQTIRAEVLEKAIESENISASPKHSSEILTVLLQEEAPLEIICRFIRKECNLFKKSEEIIELMKFLLTSKIHCENNEKENKISDEFWFCALHFNLIVATLKGLTLKTKMEFLEFVENLNSALAVKTAVTFSQALALRIEKNAENLTKNNKDEFFNLLTESLKIFEKGNKLSEWEILLENISKSKKQDWFLEDLAEWKKRKLFIVPQ